MKKKVCVVGGGYWGANHIKTLGKLGALGGVVDTNPDTLNAVSNQYTNLDCMKSIDIALSKNYDGFIVSTPANSHFEVARKIILHRKPVLIEKPMTLTIEEAEELVALSKQMQVNIMVGHVLLFHPAIIKIKKIIENGTIGDLQYIYSNRLNLGKVRTEENVFWSLAPHDIAIFQFLTKSNPTHITSHGSIILQEGIPDSTITYLQYPKNIKGHIFVSWLHPFKEHRLVVIGSKAMVSFEDSAEGRPLKLYSKKFDFVSGVPEKVDGPVQWVPFKRYMPLTKELEYFLKHMNDKKLEICNGEHGLNVMKVLVNASNQLL